METSIEKRVKESFARQSVMATIGASITRVEQGEVTVELPFRSDLTQQHVVMTTEKSPASGVQNSPTLF